MSLRSWWHQRRRKPLKQDPDAKPVVVTKEDLREFVYLDEVSLRSLLSSLKGDLRDGTSEDTSDAREIEAAISAEVSSPLAGKAGGSSRFQTSNSSSIQTSRKATVQSWFRDLHEVPDIYLVEKSAPEVPADTTEILKRTSSSSLMVSSEDLTRGELVEFRVKLAADPVYHLSTVTTELAGMADDYPEMFGAGGGAEQLRQLAPVRKILERLLAGLVPIRAVAIDHVVIQLDGTDYVVHKGLIKELDLESEPLEIVGVTELLAYWKDLRRVLFSDAEFTLLARISKSGIQPSWTPVKLADIFREMVPKLVAQINAAGKVHFHTQVDTANPAETRMEKALSHYAAQAIAASGVTLDDADKERLGALIEMLRVRVASVSDQNSAFKVLHRWVEDRAGVEFTPEQGFVLREEARDEVGLSLFPALEASVSKTLSQTSLKDEREKLLDVEIIAIYW